MLEASIWLFAMGLTGIITAGVVVAATVGEWISDMFDNDEPEEPGDETIEDRTRRAA